MTLCEIDQEDNTAEKNVPFPLRLWEEVYPKFGELYESLKKDKEELKKKESLEKKFYNNYKISIGIFHFLLQMLYPEIQKLSLEMQ